MRIIRRSQIDAWATEFKDAAPTLKAWRLLVRGAAWANLAAVRADMPHADGVKVDSGRIVTVFNIRGNKYRLITAIHYNRQRVYAMRFLTHKEYDTNKWKREL